jgi:SAM-dependent methyltransferase
VADLDVLDLGCGTGLLSFLLAPDVQSLVGVDTASAMLDAFNAKITQLPNPSSANLIAVNVLLQDADDAQIQSAAATLATRLDSPGNNNHPYRFDLIVSHLTLHHIPSLAEILSTLYQCLRLGGMVALTDYEDFGVDAVRFHPPEKREGVERHGIKKSEMEEVMRKVGFSDVRVERAWTLTKGVEAEGEAWKEEKMEFPFLLCMGTR